MQKPWQIFKERGFLQISDGFTYLLKKKQKKHTCDDYLVICNVFLSKFSEEQHPWPADIWMNQM